MLRRRILEVWWGAAEVDVDPSGSHRNGGNKLGPLSEAIAAGPVGYLLAPGNEKSLVTRARFSKQPELFMYSKS